jgi:hypothetical protein
MLYCIALDLTFCLQLQTKQLGYMKTPFTTMFTFMLGAASVFATQPSSPLTAEQALHKADKQFFIENKGQWHSDVLYLTRMGGLDVWITKYGVNYTFFKIEKNYNAKKAERLPSKFDNDLEDATLLGQRVLMKLQNPNANPLTQGKLKQAGYYNYLIGNDPSKHASNVGLYKEAMVKNVYKGIDLRYYFDKGSLRYDFIVQPGADPSQIRFSLEGEDKEYLKNGALCYTTRFGEVQMQDLYVYQQSDKKHVPAKFTGQNGVWQFQLSGYDKTQPLIIDPLIYSTYIGGTGDDYGNAIAVDGSGNAYITGYTYSTNYDITPGAFQTTFGGGTDGDVFVTQLNSTGTGLIYSTYIGGSSGDEGRGIAIDGSGNVYVTGRTFSTNFDITPGAFQTIKSVGLGGDVFVTKLNNTGTALIYSTYIGGNGGDEPYDIAIDNSGNAYITGYTTSTDYDITPGAFQTTFTMSGNTPYYEVFVTKLNSTGTALIYSTYIGGNDHDVGYSIAVDGSGNVYITGNTESNNYDITPGAFQTTYGGGANNGGGGGDVFVTKLNSTGSALIYSTYIGGSGTDMGYSIAIDNSGNAYITGYTQSTNYNITPGSFQTNLEGPYGAADAFVSKLNSTGTGLIYSTYIGGSFGELGYAIAIDGSGNAYITGRTTSTDFDITLGAFQTSNGGFFTGDVFVTKLNSAGNGLIYSTYIGGSNNEEGRGIAIDGPGSVYITGNTQSTDYDTTLGAFQTTIGGGRDVFVTKINLVVGLPPQPGPISGNINVCASSTQTYSIAPVSLATSYTWTLPSGWTGNSTTESITVTVGSNGGNISVTANNGGGSSIARTLSIIVNPLPDVTVNNNADTLTANNAGATYQWIDCNNNNAPISGATNQSFTPASSGSYAVIVTLNGCSDTSACQTVTITGISTHALSKLSFSIYPNPNRGNFTIQTDRGGEFELMDITGKVINTYTITNSQQTVNETLPAGMYFVRDKDSGSVQKLIIE